MTNFWFHVNINVSLGIKVFEMGHFTSVSYPGSSKLISGCCGSFRNVCISSSAELQMSEHLVAMDFCDLGSAGTFLLPVSSKGGGRATAHLDAFLLTFTSETPLFNRWARGEESLWHYLDQSNTVAKLYYSKQENPEAGIALLPDLRIWPILNGTARSVMSVLPCFLQCIWICIWGQIIA